MTTVHTVRNSMAPTAAPLSLPHQQAHTQFQNDQYQQYQYQQTQQNFFPSPNSAGHGMSPGYDAFQLNDPLVPNLINGLQYYEFTQRVLQHVQSNPDQGHHAKQTTIETHFDSFKDDLIKELRKLKEGFYMQYGVQVPTNKRRNDDEDPLSSHQNSPDNKKIRVDEDCESGDEEAPASPQGRWRCLYYEEDPEQYFHCKEKNYKRVSELRRHIKTHTLPHYCDKCGYRTAEERRLQSHKCESANRKKYPPVTEEDRMKHEQLARMGIKVGQMRTILFGKKSDAESINGHADDSESSEPSRQPSPTRLTYPNNIPNGGMNPMPINGLNPIPFYVTTSPQHPGLVATSHPSPPYGYLPTLHPTPPFRPGSTIPHSPVQGEAASYYHGTQRPDFTLYPQGLGAAYGAHTPSDGSNSSPSNYAQSPPMQYYTTQPEQDPSPVARVDSLNTFLQDVFPEVNDGPGATGGVINRAMPKEEIREMERNMKIREKAEKRAAKEERRRLGLEKGFLEKSRSFFLSLSSSSSSPGLCPDRKIFWRRSTAPATVPVAGQTLAVAAPLLPDAPSVSSLDAPENQNAQNTQGMNGTIMPTVKVTSPTPVNGEGTQNEEMVTEKTEGPAVKKEVPGEQGDKKEQGGEEEHTGFVGSLKRIFTLRLGARRSTN
ncbi:Protein of unknown function [Pyronema omphalodes CBS 100304]|uniref:C2H2-type domain-containing protein n=1 Tax=Pyronema omphalodes (strain CBS 100304) TaxID=1076935 RepID=U4L0B1_PYROM|nr:Protein of unknown function [Pyronema omphalodes CBS 100304]